MVKRTLIMCSHTKTPLRGTQGQGHNYVFIHKRTHTATA